MKSRPENSLYLYTLDLIWKISCFTGERRGEKDTKTQAEQGGRQSRERGRGRLRGWVLVKESKRESKREETQEQAVIRDYASYITVTSK